MQDGTSSSHGAQNHFFWQSSVPDRSCEFYNGLEVQSALLWKLFANRVSQCGSYCISVVSRLWLPLRLEGKQSGLWAHAPAAENGKFCSLGGRGTVELWLDLPHEDLQS